MDPVLQAAHEATRRVAPGFTPRRRVARSVKTHTDWEFAGRYPFGWDLGLLWVGLREAARDAVEQAIQRLPPARREQALLGAVLASARELEVRRVSLRQGAGHPLVRDLTRDLALALERWGAV